MPSSRAQAVDAASRICACTVTSSAVVGSSAMSKARLAGERHRDHDALALAAGELVRIAVERLARARQCRRGRAARSARPRASRRVTRDGAAARLGDLLADGEDRIERGHRLLEDHADAVAADRAQASRVERQRDPRPRTGCGRPSICPGGSGKRRMIDSAVTVLPQPDSPTRPSISPGSSENETSSHDRRAADRHRRGAVDAEERFRSCGACADSPPGIGFGTPVVVGRLRGRPRVERTAR